MKKAVLLILTLAMAVTMYCACKGGDTSDTQSSNGNSGNSSETILPDNGDSSSDSTSDSSSNSSSDSSSDSSQKDEYGPNV